MRKTVSDVEARRDLGQLLEGVSERGDEVAIERAGKVMGVVVSPKAWNEFQKQKRETNMERYLAAGARIHAANPELQELSEEELQQFIDSGALPDRVRPPIPAAH
jgi:prevent-host-death family protein